MLKNVKSVRAGFGRRVISHFLIFLLLLILPIKKVPTLVYLSRADPPIPLCARSCIERNGMKSFVQQRCVCSTKEQTKSEICKSILLFCSTNPLLLNRMRVCSTNEQTNLFNKCFCSVNLFICSFVQQMILLFGMICSTFC